MKNVNLVIPADGADSGTRERCDGGGRYLHDLPADWSALCAIVFLLGLKHGFDADHLATIDGLTRLNARHGRPFARYCGALFSLGHGAVVIAIALAIGLASERWDPPAWLDALGAWISILFLTALGVVNLRAVLAAAPGEVVAPIGLKGRFLGRLRHARRPGAVALVGALFALSFDTVSQSALFALTATQFGGVEHALFLGALFVLGMLVTDGINGLWISRLIARTDQLAVIASRVMSLAVSGVSLLVAALGAAKMVSPLVDGWSDGKELFFGVVVVAVIAGSYLLARRLAQRSLGSAAAAA
jgi:high-affinity nickel-transport protein